MSHLSADPPNDVPPSTDKASDWHSRLRTRFMRLWTRCLLEGAKTEPGSIWDALDIHYSERHRYYHTTDHIAHCLRELDLARDQIPHPDRVEMGIWFHDIIYEPGKEDNEARSADFFRKRATGAMDSEFVVAVEELILATTHRTMPVGPDRGFICDIDLSSFGLPWEGYMRDTENLRRELQVSDEEYDPKKRRFLEAMLSRPKIFVTDSFNARYEEQARTNIRRLLSLMDRGRDCEAPQILL